MFKLRNMLNQRFFEILVPTITWLMITMPLWLSPFHPAVVAYLLIAFNVYFFYKTLRSTILATVSYINIERSQKIDWFTLAKKNPDFYLIKNFVIVSSYNEPLGKLRLTIENMLVQKYDLKSLYIVLALENDEGQSAIYKANALKEKYGSFFGGFFATYHKLIPGEIKGKGSNEAFAAKWISEEVKRMGLNSKQVIITSCDADSLLDKQYFAYLTNIYLKDDKREYHFFWAPVLLYNNYWKLNFFIRMQTTVSSVLRLSMLSEKQNLIQISTYSMSLWLLEEVGFWDTDIIPEDWHLFLQAFFKFGSLVHTKPIYLITIRDGVRGKNFIDSLRNRYDQEKRWAWGVSDVPYALDKLFNDNLIPFFDKFFRVFYLFESHILWPTSFFLLTIGANIPGIVNPYFKRTVLGYILPQLSGGILTLTSLFVIVIAFIDYQAKHKLLRKSETGKVPLLLMQWILFPLLSPIISAFLSSLPALESHTRLLLNRKIDYKVTKKY